jgi:hypothetical protein
VSFLADSKWLWDVTPVTHTVLALTHPHGAATSASSTTHWFAIGLLVGVVTMLTPPVIRAAVILFDIVALGWSYGILHWADTSRGHWVWIALLFLLIGLFVGVIRGLRHLSDFEFGARRKNIRSIGRYF